MWSSSFGQNQRIHGSSGVENRAMRSKLKI